MANPALEFHPEAAAEYLEALAWYNERSPRAARNFESAVIRAVEQIQRVPERWPISAAGCRRFLLHQFPFQIVYCTFENRIIVIAVAHTHRRPGYWRNRL